jgi:MoaA/NifB/PqqE/SkfB family radical SAM enzyme
MILETEKSYLGKKNSFKCPAGKKMINISEQGEVCICEMVADPVLGNLREYDYDPGEIIRLPVSVERLKRLSQKGCNCYWDCAINGSLLFGGFAGYRKILSNMFTRKFNNTGNGVN